VRGGCLDHSDLARHFGEAASELLPDRRCDRAHQSKEQHRTLPGPAGPIVMKSSTTASRRSLSSPSHRPRATGRNRAASEGSTPWSAQPVYGVDICPTHFTDARQFGQTTWIQGPDRISEATFVAFLHQEHIPFRTVEAGLTKAAIRASQFLPRR
jgi:hypothetical protein